MANSKRPIKFRGETTRGQFVYGDLLRQHVKTLIYDGAYNQVKPNSVSQLIAIDQNDCEVYEHDAIMYLGTQYPKSATFRDYAAIEDGLAVKHVRRASNEV